MGRSRRVKNHLKEDQYRTDIMAQNYIPRQHFSLDEKLELSESRCIEFKAGPGFINNGFRDNVGKYVCGFVNSNENGTLLLGVENSGLVGGYVLNRGEEDFIRRQVDEAIKDITPDIFPKDYSLRFVPVLDHHGNNSGARCVVEISVLGSNFIGKDRLYESKQGVFLRRDGSLEGPLKAKKIQEWTRRTFESEMEKLRKNERNLTKEMENRKSEFNRKMMELDLKERELELRQKALDKQQHDYKLLKEELQMRNLEFDRQKATISQLQDDQQTKSHKSDETLKELGEIKEMLSKQNKKSQVCSIM